MPEYYNEIGENTRWIYFTVLQLTISWINDRRFTNHGPDYLNIIFLRPNTVLPSAGL
jgi:hypothetical protein